MRIMMVIVTKSNTWTPELIRIREILHIVSGININMKDGGY